LTLPYDSPNVLIVTPGTYSEDFYLQRGLLNLYVIGEPGTRPVLAHDNLNLDGLETGYLKNLELNDTTVNTGSNLTIARSTSTSRRSTSTTRRTTQTASRTPAGSPLPGGSWRYWFWNFHGSQMGWQSNSAAPDVHRGTTRLAAPDQQYPYHGDPAVQRHQVDPLLRQHPYTVI
jgi:hypothetical protein